MVFIRLSAGDYFVTNNKMKHLLTDGHPEVWDTLEDSLRFQGDPFKRRRTGTATFPRRIRGHRGTL
jgi:hypothetical protein